MKSLSERFESIDVAAWDNCCDPLLKEEIEMDLLSEIETRDLNYFRLVANSLVEDEDHDPYF